MAGVRVEPLSTREKLCYAVGEFSGVMTYDIISLYANIFLLEVVKLTPLAATAVIFGSRVWDVLAYPLLIPVLNATRPNKWGKHKTWMAASTLIVIPSYVLGWYVPGIDSGGKVAWYLVFYSVYLVSQTETGYLVSAGTTAAIITIAVCATLFGVKEYTGSTVTGDDTSRGTLLKDIWEVCTFRPFADLVGLGMLSCFGTTLQQWSAAIAIQYAHGLEDQVQNLLLALLGASVLTIPVAALLLTRFEKKLVLAGFALADSVAFTTRLLVSFIPAGATLLSLVFLWRYQLTGERLAANKAVLEERRTQQAADTNVNGAAPQLSLTMKSHDEPDTRGPVQLTYFGPHGSFRVKHH
uniref:Uncharacterized protein n=1 Tax=Branchiostoma floridae TaxID=7739 RepID=C3Z1G8_BRAFL|eukprot:XP_002597574.1 hypothetical protein BRAFLDRAFT_82320 [Branchiostoma floridae]